VQVEILAILAVIMTQDFNQDHIETSAVLNTDYFFDIFFNHGAVTLRSDPNQGNTYSVVSHMDTDSCHQVEGSRVNQQPLQDSRTIQAQINREENVEEEKIDILETIDRDILTKENEEFYKRSVEEFLQDVVQQTSSEESDLNAEPQKKIMKKKNKVSTPQKEPLVPDNPSDYDNANDSTCSKSFEEIQDGEFNEEEEGEDESLPSLIDEEEKVREENEKWDQYFGINKTVIPA
jgi:hypothetical protein